MSGFPAHVRKEFVLWLRDWPAVAFALAGPVAIVGLYALLRIDFTQFRFSNDFRETHPTALVLGLAVWLPSLYAATSCLFRERLTGTLARLSVTPFRPLELLVAKAIVLAAVAIAQAMIIAATSWWWVGSAFAPQSPLHVFWALAALGIATVATGLLCATLVGSPAQSANLVTLLTLGSITLCGFFKPVSDLGLLRSIGVALPFSIGYQSLRAASDGDGIDRVANATLGLEAVVLLLLAWLVLEFRLRRN